MFSNTGEIEVLPALPDSWGAGEIRGLMARTRVEIQDLSWNINNKNVSLTIKSQADNNVIKLTCGLGWTTATVNGQAYTNTGDCIITLSLNDQEEVTVNYTLPDLNSGTYQITNGSKRRRSDRLESRLEHLAV